MMIYIVTLIHVVYSNAFEILAQRVTKYCVFEDFNLLQPLMCM